MNKILHLLIITFFVTGFITNTNAQSIYIEGSITSLRMDNGPTGDCSSSVDPEIWAGVSVSSAAWSGSWQFSTDDVGFVTGSCGMTCNAGSCSSCGFYFPYSGNANWSTTQTIPQNWQVQIYGYEDDGGCPFDSNDGDCGSYSMVRNTDILSGYGGPNCAGGYYTGSDSRNCTSDGSTYTYTAAWRFRYYFTGLTDANAGGTTSGPDKICAGSTATFSVTEPLSSRYSSLNWQLNGSDLGGGGDCRLYHWCSYCRYLYL